MPTLHYTATVQHDLCELWSLCNTASVQYGHCVQYGQDAESGRRACNVAAVQYGKCAIWPLRTVTTVQHDPGPPGAPDLDATHSRRHSRSVHACMRACVPAFVRNLTLLVVAAVGKFPRSYLTIVVSPVLSGTLLLAHFTLSTIVLLLHYMAHSAVQH